MNEIRTSSLAPTVTVDPAPYPGLGRRVGQERLVPGGPSLWGTTNRMTLDVPDEVRSSALADGHAAWLDGLPSVLDSLAQDWSLTIGATMRGGSSALVVEATLADETPSVLKVGVPGYRRQLGFEATVLDLDAGASCARLIRRDLTQGALLLERLGPAMYDVILDSYSQHDMLCDLVAQLWRPIDDAVECANRRERAYHRRTSVLVHGDVHEMNALQAEGGIFKLIDPVGLRAETACDLGTIVRCTPDAGDDLRVRTEHLAARTGVDATAIWEWGTVHRVSGGLNSVRIGFQPFGNLLLAEADRLTQTG